MIWKTLRLNERTQDNTDKIKILQHQVEAIGKGLHWLNQEMQRISEREQHEREKLELRLEIERLRAERGLPPAKTKDKSNQKAQK